MTFGEKINELRKEKNLTLKELANLSGISQATLTNWTRNRTKSKPQPIAVKKVADALGYDYQELLKML